MSISSQYLDAFYMTAQLGHFTKAASKLHISQSALSQRISNLEKELETAVFIRGRSGLKLTPAGQELLKFCQAKASLEQESIDKIRNPDSHGISGYIRIGGFSSVMRSVILPALSPLIKSHSTIRLLFQSREMTDLPQMHKHGEIDYMILDHQIIRDDLVSIKLGEETNVLVEKKGYKGAQIFLDHDEDDETTSHFMNLKNSKAKIQRNYLDDIYGIIDGVKLGLGRAVVPYHLIAGDRAFSIIDSKVKLKLPIYLHFYTQPYYTELHKEVIATLTANTPTFLKTPV